MEFTEAQEVDYIVAQSVSKNIFGNANGQVNNRQKSAKFEQLSDSSDEDDRQTQFQSKQGNGMSQNNRQKENQTSLISNLLKSDGDTESMDDMINQINSIVSSQYEQKKKQFEEEQERIKMLKEIMQQENEEQKKMEISKTNSIIVYKNNSGEKIDENAQQSEQNGMEKSNGYKSKEKQNNNQDYDDSDEEEDDEDEDYDDDDEQHRYNNRQNRNGNNSDNNEDKFEQVPEDCIIQSFNNVVLKQVSLLKNTTQQKNSLAKLASNPRAQKLDVYFFGTSFNMKVPYDDNTTIQDFIKIIIDFYMADPNTDKSLMRYPKYPQAYNLRMKDDDGYKPDSNLGPIEPKYPVQNFSKEQIVIMEIDRFMPPAEDFQDSIARKIKQKTIQKGLDLLNVTIEELGAQLNIEQSPQSTIKQVLEYLRDKKNAKISIKDCIVFYYDYQEEKYIELDLNTSISQLPSQDKKIRIKKKEWADTPRITNQQVQYAPNLPAQILQSEPISNMNLVKYEEFNVIKINDKKKRQERVLGIDQHKILNINKRIQQQDIGFLNKIFVNPQTGTKNPSRKIEDIQFIQELENNIVIMKVKDPDQQYEKTLKYEIANSEDRRKIIKKIEGLMELYRKDTLKKFNMNIMNINNMHNMHNLNYMNNMTNVPNMMTYSNYNGGTTSLR
ncbi:hypothetical protein TTHERM_00550880 (macronuclear) [Tetrahymena thermophila SB210]|uniref:Uncharacterized protein n=1 Tax=Tetrahymena thermophila (strain SB210) TaxID=312017 RepID=Q22UN6_TETTS|nr:hypothetical protein TTHERM_00550880 [Tetrahymena thermophila SB210]EAR88934.2 hypothetical protein TTHERM_00550880 [Tetrahymena thermophila SB210]|eukprot:XP_001009179.2 hypothetical protein TTHERM_00550880 [Tetrahymena thermophila SB210]